MLRRAFILTVAYLCVPADALAHEAADAHVHAGSAHFPWAEVLSGLALILAGGSFWMSLRTRRTLLKRDAGRCGL